jgi:hypothetical protein
MCTFDANVIWEVEARQGGADGMARTWHFDTEGEARQFVERCLTGPRQWRDLTRLVAASSPDAVTPTGQPAGEAGTAEPGTHDDKP